MFTVDMDTHQSKNYSNKCSQTTIGPLSCHAAPRLCRLQIVVLYLGNFRSNILLEEEWDNPFQPEGEVSQDADLIIQLWKGGKLAESEDLEQNLKSLVLETEKESDTEDTEDESNAEDDENSKQANGVNGFKSLSPSKKPVINSSDVGYLVMINGPEKHKNKIKKHCNLM